MNHAQRIEEMKRSKRRQEKFRKIMKRIIPVFLCVFIVLLIVLPIKAIKNKQNIINGNFEESQTALESVNQETMNVKQDEESQDKKETFKAVADEDTVSLTDEIASAHAILIDVDQERIVGRKDADSQIVPASMTKVLTILVAAEQIEDLDAQYTISQDVIDYCFKNDCSNAGFEAGEQVSVRDLFYATILPSGADAALSLADYVAGSNEAFVELMNQKLAQLGIDESAHFTNCIGVYEQNHYCTTYDMAIIMEAAIHNELCREVMSAHTYTTSKSEYHPDGITLSNWFLRRIEDKDSGGIVLCAKTGYVLESENCAVSMAESKSGKEYICVTAGAYSGWKCIYDHVAVYKQYMNEHEYYCDGFILHLDNKQIDLKEQEEGISSVSELLPITNSVLAIVCRIDMDNNYLLIYDFNKKEFLFQSYGMQLAWVQNDKSSVVFLKDDTVYTLDGKEVFKADEKEHISVVEYIDTDLYVTVTDLNYENPQSIHVDMAK